MGKVIWNDSASDRGSEVLDTLPLRFCEDPFLELIYGESESNSWYTSRWIKRLQFSKHHDITSQVCRCRYPKWMIDQDSPDWGQVEASCASWGQRGLFPQAYRILNKGICGEKADSEDENQRLKEIVNEAIDLASSVNEHAFSDIDFEFRPNGWPDAYNGCLNSFAFCQPKGALPKEVVMGCDIRWDLRPHDSSIIRKPSDPSHLIIDVVFSVSLPVTSALGDLARQVSLEKGGPSYAPGFPAVTAPWLIVEYVKFESGSSVAKSTHESHLAGAFEVALGLYESLGLDLPLFGLLVDRMTIQLFSAALVKVPGTQITEIHYFKLAEFEVTLVDDAYEFCHALDGVMRHANVLRERLSERLSLLDRCGASL